jgi:hypothetical protein
MFWEFAPYFLLLVLGAGATVLLTSKTLSEKLVDAGLMPRAFLGLLPLLQTVVRVFGVILIGVGLVKICVDNGWINPAVLSRYAFSASVILLGVVLLLMSRRQH